MASGIFVLLDDIAALMDDVAAVSKIATKKTAGILGDDLAVNADKASGFESSREIPVLLKIMKGSFINKLIILPFAFVLSAFVPIAVTIILVLGALFLAFEGAEKIYEYFVPHDHGHSEEITESMTEEQALKIEQSKIKSAIVTDFILSVEIVIIALGTVLNEPLVNQIMAVSFVAILATVGVYGIVALIVRMDDLGFKIIKKSDNPKSFTHKIGEFLVNALPWVIKGLAFLGTIALFMVAGGIFVHNIDFVHHLVEKIPETISTFIVGVIVGFIVLGIYKLIKSFLPKKEKH